MFLVWTHFEFLQFGIPRCLPLSITKNSAEHENENISVTAKLILTEYVRMILALSCLKLNKNRPVKMAPLTKNSKV